MRLGMGLGLGNLLSGQPLTGFPNDFSFNLDGSNDYLNIGTNSGIEFTGTQPFTISMWVNLDSVALMAFCYKRSGSNGYIWQVHSDGTLEFSTGTGSTLEASRTTTTISANEWTHIAVVRTANEGKALFYKNGALMTINSSNDPDHTSMSDNSTIPLTIGEHGGSRYFNGKIDEFSMFNAELSADDIAKLGSKPVDLSKSSTYATDRTSNLKLWLRAGDKALPESDTAIARQDFYTDFDGTNDYVELSEDIGQSLTDANAFSVSSWINPTDVSTFNNTIITGHDRSTFSIQRHGTGLLIYVANNIIINLPTLNKFANNKWSHVVVTYDEVNLKYYIDGELVGTQASTVSINTHGTIKSLYIGAQNGTSAFFTGAISNVSVYQTALDAQTISQMAKSRFSPVRNSRFSVVDFDGSDDRITTNADSTLADTTYTYWAKSTTTGSNYGVFGHGSTSIGSFAMNVGNTPFLSIGGSTNTRRFWSDVSAQDDGEWHHWAVYVDSTNISNAKLYIDGVLQTPTSTNGSTTIESYSEPLTIGASQQSSGDAWEGSFAQFAVYSGEKNSDFIYAQYQKGITADYSSDANLTGYWRMGDDTSKAYPTIADSSSNSNDGTITNGASDDIVQQMVAGYDLGAFESSSEELGGSQIPSASNRTYSGVSSNDWTSNGTTKSFSNDKMVFTFDGDSPAVVAQLSASSIGSGSGIPNGFLKVTFEIDSSTTGTYNFNNAGGSVTGSIFQLNPISAGTHTVYANVTNGNSGSYFRFYEVSGSTGDKLVLNSFDIQEVLQSEVSDTYPAIIDVNEPVLGVEEITNGTFDTDSDWTKSSVTISGGKANFSSGGSTALYQDIGSSLTGMYFISFEITDYTSGTLKVYGGGQDSFSDSHLTEFSAVGSYVEGIYLESSFNGNIIFGGGSFTGSIDNVSVKPIQGNVGNMTNQAPDDLVYSSVLPDQSFLVGNSSPYNFIDLGGTDEYISLPESFITDIATQTGTVNLWVKPTSDNDADQQLFTYNNSSIRTDLLFRYGWGDNRINLGIAQSGSQKWFAYSATNSVSSHLNNWNMITLVHNGTEPKLYANGIELSITFGISTDKTFWFGDMVGVDRASIGIWNQTSLQSAFIGNIGQTSFWNKDLSASEILAIYNLGRHGNLLDSYSEGLKGYYALGSFDAKTGLSDIGDGTIYDRSGNSNHGTPTNTESTDLKSSPNAEPNGYAKGDTNRSTTTP